RGQIEALGKLLPTGVEIIDFLEDQSAYSRGDFDKLVDSVIPQDFWTMKGIDWLSNAVTAHGNCYCDVSMSVEVLMSQFPGERTPVDGAEFVGDCLLVKERAAGNIRQPPRRPLGRPPAFACKRPNRGSAGRSQPCGPRPCTHKSGGSGQARLMSAT